MNIPLEVTLSMDPDVLTEEGRRLGKQFFIEVITARICALLPLCGSLGHAVTLAVDSALAPYKNAPVLLRFNSYPAEDCVCLYIELELPE